MGIGARIKKVRQTMNMNQVDFANKIGLARSYLSEVESEAKQPSGNLLQALAELGVSLDYVVSGLGTPNFKNPKADDVHFHVHSDVHFHQKLHLGIPLVGQPVQAGYLAGYADAEWVDELPRLVLPGLSTNGGEWLAFEVRGESMHPTLHATDIVVCVLLQEHRELHAGRVHVVVTRTEGIVVKRVYMGTQGLLLKSDNPSVAPCTLPYDDLVQIWEVKRRITAELEVSDAVPLVHELENRMEARLKALEKGAKGD